MNSYQINSAIGFAAVLLPVLAIAHGVSEGDAAFIEGQSGFQFWPYFYLGAKHMVTGYDHLAFLAGVIFFLYRLKEIAIYVTLFAIGHSATLIVGVWFDVPANIYLIDAIIGFSVIYKAFENMGGLQKIGLSINTKYAVLVFGLFHGFGLATKLQQLNLSNEGLIQNLIAFNIGVELGQFSALIIMITLMNLWRRTSKFNSQAVAANSILMCAGFLFIFYQLTGYVLDS